MNRSRPFLFAALLLLLLALALTWPLPLHLATHAPGDGSDDPAILWNLWWVRYAITELGQSPFDSAWMFWPLGIPLVFYTLTMLNALLSIPVQLALGLVPANSFIVYFELVVAGLGAWLLARWLFARHRVGVPLPGATRDRLALVAAAVFAFGSSKWLYLSLGQFNIAASHWLPWALLYLCRLWLAPSWRAGLRDAALCALFLLFTGWTEFTYASFFAQLALLLWIYLMLVAAWGRAGARAARFTGLGAVVAGLFVLGMAPILLAMMRAGGGDFLVEGLGFSNVFSTDLLGFLVPGDHHPLFGAWVRDRFSFAYLNFAFLGWTTLALVALAVWDRRTRPFTLPWLPLAAIFTLFSLGPTLRINGREWELPLPFDALLRIPLVQANRYPSRYAVVLSMLLGLVAAWGAAALWQRWESRGAGEQESGRGHRASLSPFFRFSLLLALLLFEHLGAPLPLTDFRVPSVYEGVRVRPGASLLEVPLAWRNGFRVTGTLHPAFMLAQAHQAAHGKRLLSGNTSRNPPFKFQYFTELPVINSLLALETGHALPPGRTARDTALAPELLRLLDAPTVLVRRITQADPLVTTEATLPYLEQVLSTTRWWDEGEFVGLDVALPPAPTRYEWDGAHPLARLFFAEGWSALPPLEVSLPNNGDVYAQDAEARLLIPSIATEGDWQLRFRVWLPEGVETPVTVLAADPAGGAAVPLATLQLWGAQEYTVRLPATGPRGPLTEVRFRFGALQPAQSFLASTDQPLSVVAESAGLAVGNFAHLYVNGGDVAQRGTGFHAAIVAPTGEVEATGHFDTFNDPTASTALARFIESATPGALVALAVADTPSAGAATGGLPLGEEATAALESLGSSNDLSGCYGCSFALVAIKGNPNPQEDLSPIRPARAWLGSLLQAPTVAARFDGFVVEPAE